MKSDRQKIILECISEADIETQDELIKMMATKGVRATQATVSRDIRELKLSKVMTPDGAYKYVAPKEEVHEIILPINRAVMGSIKGIDHSGNIIVINTHSGMASAVAAGLDAMNVSEILGCVAGDDTIICVTREAQNAREICARIRSMIGAV